MKTFARGQRSRLDALSSSLDLSVGLAIEAPSNLVFDFCCFGVDEANHLHDDRYFVFYNQPSAPDNAIVMRGAHDGDRESFEVHLGLLPPTVRRLVFTATIDGGGTMAQIRRGHLRLSDAGGEIVRYEFSGDDFSTEQALLIGEIYWKDGWRFGAVGQGFAGNLSRLLEHFGGIEIEDNPVAPSQNAPQSTLNTGATAPMSSGTPPTPPVSAPAMVSPQSLATSAAPFPVGGQLQSLIDGTAPGGHLVLLRDEYEGPVAITRPITIDGRGSAIWARQGPVLRLHSTQVILRDLDIEVTVPESGEGDVALWAEAAPQLHNVAVRGRVVGVGAKGEWKLPDALDLGEFAPRQVNQWHFEIEVPTACDLKSSISGLTLHPPQVAAGRQHVEIQVRDIARETLLAGRIEVREGELLRPIPVFGRAARDEGAAPVQGKALWTPEYNG